MCNNLTIGQHTENHTQIVKVTANEIEDYISEFGFSKIKIEKMKDQFKCDKVKIKPNSDLLESIWITCPIGIFLKREFWIELLNYKKIDDFEINTCQNINKVRSIIKSMMEKYKDTKHIEFDTIKICDTHTRITTIRVKRE